MQLSAMVFSSALIGLHRLLQTLISSSENVSCNKKSSSTDTNSKFSFFCEKFRRAIRMSKYLMILEKSSYRYICSRRQQGRFKTSPSNFTQKLKCALVRMHGDKEGTALDFTPSRPAAHPVPPTACARLTVGM